MLYIEVPELELWDENTRSFLYTEKQPLQLEHSLISLVKWEEKWNKPFMSKEEKTKEELIDYIKCMTVSPNERFVDPLIYEYMPNDIREQINEYIDSPMTATHITEYKTPGQAPSREIITAEIIYFWMITFGIPLECQKWHLNKLLTLIRVCEIKNRQMQPGRKKQSRREIMSKNAAINAARRKQLNTTG